MGDPSTGALEAGSEDGARLLVVENIGQLVTCAGPREAGAESALGLVNDALLVCEGEGLRFAGAKADLEKAGLRELLQRKDARHLDAKGALVTPGFVDPHTHLAFDGDRAAEFAERCAGTPYETILKRGGGILETVRATREADFEQLTALVRSRLRRLLSQGVTTVEVKSGYALEVQGELRLLEIIEAAAAELPMRVERTLLGAHALPPEFIGRQKDYVSLVCTEMIPEVARRHLAAHVDAFVEVGAFDKDDARQIAEAASRAGLSLRLHVDQLTAGRGAELAVSLGALSADHLEQVSHEGIELLAKSGVVAGLLPTATLYARLSTWAPGRLLSDAGAILAIGSNFNPGTAMCDNHALALGLACLWNGLTPAEALLAATEGAARSLGLESELGSLRPGARADLVLHDARDYRQLSYQLARESALVVIAGGEIVVDKRELSAPD